MCRSASLANKELKQLDLKILVSLNSACFVCFIPTDDHRQCQGSGRRHVTQVFPGAGGIVAQTPQTLHGERLEPGTNGK